MSNKRANITNKRASINGGGRNNDSGSKQVFLSWWSGDYSQQIAKIFAGWLNEIFDGRIPEVYYAKDCLEVGKEIRIALARQLSKTKIIILCYTPHNLKSEWMLFEAGAVFGQCSEDACICPVLFGDLNHNSLPKVFKEIQPVRFDKEGMKKLLGLINETYNHVFDDVRNINTKVDKTWRSVESQIKKTMKSHSPKFDCPLKVPASRSPEQDFDCHMVRHPLAEDIKKTLSLIAGGRIQLIVPAHNFAEEAGKERSDENCKSFRAVFPITDLGQKYFDSHAQWFDDEVGLSSNQKKRIQRIVIVKHVNGGIADVEVVEYLKKYIDRDWYVIHEEDAKDRNKSLFREFCILQFIIPKRNLAYFTYLDKEHKRFFTKGPWDQYKTKDKEYIEFLEARYELLLNKSKPIKEWVSHQKRIREPS